MLTKQGRKEPNHLILQKGEKPLIFSYVLDFFKSLINSKNPDPESKKDYSLPVPGTT
jgi:hypothetical protein